MLALASAVALGGTAISEGRAADAGNPTSGAVPITRTPDTQHLGPTSFSQPSPKTWRRWWHSRRRPPAAQRVIVLNGRPVVLIAEALPPGWQSPCTDGELESALRELPAAWTARLRSVRLTYQPDWGAHARTDRSRIEISYVVDEARRAAGSVFGDAPEELQFGARIDSSGGVRRFVWPDRESLRDYILRHVLVHELGHHVAPSGMRRDEEEAWAEAFAFRYFTPSPTTRVAESRR
jgi:hypothetical protein